MKKLLLISMSAFFFMSTQAQTFQWAKNMGGANAEVGYSIITDASGNSYITGSFQGTADFDPSSSTANLVSTGANDIFIAKYDVNGNYLWAHNIGGTGSDLGYSISTDMSENIYITGSFQGTADFDPSPLSTANLTSNGNGDIFIAKYDVNGNYVWAKRVGGTADDYASGIINYSLGTIVLTGVFQGTVNFGADTSIYNLTSNGSSDIFIASYDSDGSLKWAKNVGGGSADNSTSIARDVSGNIFITGYFSGNADFNPGIDVAALSSHGSQDIFIAKYNSIGNYIWAIDMGGNSSDMANSIATDASGNVIITGSFNGTADFDPSTNTENLVSNGNQDIFIAKYDDNGNYVWAFNLGSNGLDKGNAIATDLSESIYVTGSFKGTVNFDPAASSTLTAIGNSDAFVAKYDASGNFKWVDQLAGAAADEGFSINTNVNGKVYTTGSFSGIANFDSNISSSANLTSNGNTDIYVASYMQSVATDIQLNTNSEPFIVNSYPNPTTDLLTIDLGKTHDRLNVVITNTLGQTVLSKKYLNANVLDLNLYELTKGTYFVHLTTDTQSTVMKIIKQ